MLVTHSYSLALRDCILVPAVGPLAELQQLRSTGFPCQASTVAHAAREARLLTKLPAFPLNVKTSSPIQLKSV